MCNVDNSRVVLSDSGLEPGLNVLMYACVYIIYICICMSSRARKPESFSMGALMSGMNPPACGQVGASPGLGVLQASGSVQGFRISTLSFWPLCERRSSETGEARHRK